MAKYGSPSVTITYNSQDITQYITDINDIDVESLMEETTTFGDDWAEHTPVGMFKMGDLKLKGFYDDTATTGPDALFNDLTQDPTSSAKTLVITYGGSKSTSVGTFIQKYSRKLDRGKLHKFEVTLQPTGDVTEA